MICAMSEAGDRRWVFEHTHLKRSWIQHQIAERDGVLGYPPPISPSSSSPSPPSSPSTSSGTRISPAVLFIIVILAVLFFISGLLHLLVRFLMKHPSSSNQSNDRYPEVSTSDTLQRQLQQLFHLHDSGLDQAFIDALPVFMYKEIVGGATEPFDCAVCLCEFSEKDKLRLLPVCSHAFHINCIDTWLLTNSTCPLCRGTLFTPGLSIANPIFDFDYLREEDGFPNNGENGFVGSQKMVENERIVREKGVFPVRLGKFRKLGDGEGETNIGETSSSNLDARRCYSMGSYQYLVGDTSLRVALRNSGDGRDLKVLKGREYVSNRNPSIDGDLEGQKISIGSKTDSYSVSKIWLWSKKGKFGSSSDTQ